MKPKSKAKQPVPTVKKFLSINSRLVYSIVKRETSRREQPEGMTLRRGLAMVRDPMNNGDGEPMSHGIDVSLQLRPKPGGFSWVVSRYIGTDSKIPMIPVGIDDYGDFEVKDYRLGDLYKLRPRSEKIPGIVDSQLALELSVCIQIDRNNEPVPLIYMACFEVPDEIEDPLVTMESTIVVEPNGQEITKAYLSSLLNDPSVAGISGYREQVIEHSEKFGPIALVHEERPFERGMHLVVNTTSEVLLDLIHEHFMKLEKIGEQIQAELIDFMKNPRQPKKPKPKTRSSSGYVPYPKEMTAQARAVGGSNRFAK